jgi:PAS domain S-box-containing protein
MISTQSLLKRQLKRFFGSDFEIPPEWAGFVAAVDTAYSEFVVDRDLIERSMELSSQELLEANSEIQAIFQAIPDSVFRLDDTGKILSVNAAAGRDSSQRALLGRNIQECWRDHSGDGFPEVLHRVIADKSMISFEYSEGTNGVTSFHEVRVVPLLQSQVVAISRDISQRKRAESDLEEMHKRLADASRHAGRAEIANNVLHNVGNVLNSVNIAAGVIGSQVRESKSLGVAKVVELLNEHSADLGEFLTRTEKGKTLLVYMNKMVAALAAERLGIYKELESLTRSIDHIKDIVSTQQAYSGATNLSGPVQIEELVEDALRINAGSIARHQIQIVKEYASAPLLLLDKHLVLQILVNLISNAKNAMDAVPGRVHQLRLRTQICGTADRRRLRVRVEDNGEGIAAEPMAGLFTHGFTTRKNGHGFGLHSCALAAREMLGTIEAHSDGPGQGAAFTLDLPANLV